MSTVYVDSSALLPLVNEADPDHARALGAFQALTGTGADLVTTSYVLVEAGMLVMRRYGSPPFKTLGDVVMRSIDVIWVDEDLHRRAWARAAQSRRNGPSLVDWVGFLTMRDLGIDRALTLDEHFRKQGFETLP